MSELSQKKCVPCEGGIDPLDNDGIDEYLALVEGWAHELRAVDGKEIDTIKKSFKFKNFRQAMDFLRAVEEIAEEEGHHPDFCVHYSLIDFRLWTHAIGGLHLNDFILASKINQVHKKFDH